MLIVPTGAVQAQVADNENNPPVPKLTQQQLSVADRSVRVALVDSGVNYLLPAINRHLARDDAGNILGYDFWDMDALPFDHHPDGRGGILRHGTRTASLLLEEAPFAALVPYRYPRPDMTRMRLLVAHARKHAVRVIGLPLGGNRAEEWAAFESAAQQNPDILFIASAGNNGRDIDSTPVYPASLDLENMLVVTSADDFVRPAQGVNWGRVSVDYMVPAERRDVLRFDGSRGKVSGSSYAVPRVVALAARYLREDPELDASGIIARIRSHFSNGVQPAKIGQGYLHDPQFDSARAVSVRSNATLRSSIADTAAAPVVSLQLDVLVLDGRWSTPEVLQVLAEAESILNQCGIVFADSMVRLIDAADYLRDLDAGSSRTLMEAVRFSGQNRKLAVVFARDTRMSLPFDAEAFGRGNTRNRPWLTDSVWLTLALQDRGIALAHELFHVLVNSGEHSTIADNLMLDRTTGANRSLTGFQCALVLDRSVKLGLTVAEK